MSDLVLTHIRFDCVAKEDVTLRKHWAGNALRGALGQILLRTAATNDPADPVHWLLSSNHEPGSVRRAYSLVPPVPPHDQIAAGEQFTFRLTLYGSGWQFLPYFVLAVNEMGRVGVGVGRGTFNVAAITVENRLRGQGGQKEVILAPGDALVRLPSLVVTWDDAMTAAKSIADKLNHIEDGRLTLQFLTPTQLIQAKRRVKQPDFGVLFQRLLRRFDDLRRQFADEDRRPHDEIMALHTAANNVRLINSQVRWVDMRPRSGRDGKHKPLGGFVGTAQYHAQDWHLILPFLLFGQGIHVGKLASKGNGVFQLEGFLPPYWGEEEVVGEEVVSGMTPFFTSH